MSDVVHDVCLKLFVQATGYHDYDTLNEDDKLNTSHTRSKPQCCGYELRCTGDNVGGGSHYWSLLCEECHTRYSYSSYDFVLRKVL